MIKETIKKILTHYDCCRQVGHTTKTLRACDVDTVLVVHDQCMIKHLNHRTDAKIVTLADVENSALYGHRKALQFDNCALYCLLQQALHRIEELEAQNKYQW